MTTDLIFPNGINGDSGNYLTPPMPLYFLSKIARGEKIDEAHLRELKWRHDSNQPTFGLSEGDPKKLSETGWGIIFAESDPDASAIKEALAKLLDLRREQAGDYYKEFFGIDAYRQGESKQKFLARQCVGPGPVIREKVPYYLLIVGDPDLIPFSFQYQLDVQYAVGRLHFEKLEDYANYANNVIVAESRKAKLPRRAVFIGVQNEDDKATQLSAQKLVKPLAEYVIDKEKNWSIQTLLKEEATKEQIGKFLGGSETPALLFTASHGMGFNNGSGRQLSHQGALLCQDWPGPNKWNNPILPEHYFSADDVSNDANFSGLIAFHFACFSAGTPAFDDFSHRASGTPKPIAPHSFVSRLPQRLLSHRKGALAVIGHNERAWGCSFMWNQAGPQLQVFKATLSHLMNGFPIGAAFEFFNERYAELSSDLSAELDEVRHGKTPDDLELSDMWTANNDARNYAILGDPAVRLPIDES